jgi:hypothetical protein
MPGPAPIGPARSSWPRRAGTPRAVAELGDVAELAALELDDLGELDEPAWP